VPPLNRATSAAFRTTREQYETVHALAGCAACHSQFDPLGFAFEHYDEGGRYRDDEAGASIDASGRVPGTSGEQGFAFGGQEDLANALAAQPEVADCVAGLLTAYATGGVSGEGAPCIADQARALLATGPNGIVEYLAQLAAAPDFTHRDPSVVFGEAAAESTP
jgi:hypothetical protein